MTAQKGSTFPYSSSIGLKSLLMCGVFLFFVNLFDGASSDMNKGSISGLRTKQLPDHADLGANNDNDASNKRQRDTSSTNSQGFTTKRSKATNGTPPKDNKTLGDYFKDAWFKPGVTDEQKEDFLLEIKINTLKRNVNFRQEAQQYLKIDLDNFLNTGDESLTDLSFSKVKYPANDLGIKKLPGHADIAFANLIIDCELLRRSSNDDDSYRLKKYYDSKKWASELDMLYDKKSHDEGTYREYCIDLARRAHVTYRSEKTNELYKRNVLEMVAEPEENTSLGEDQLVQLKAKLISFFVRLEQQKLAGVTSWGCVQSPHIWNCCSDVRLLETLLDPEWRAIMQFAILPRGETLVVGTNQSVASTVWSNVVSVLFNNQERYKLKSRFPKDLDLWHFQPNHKTIYHRSADLLKYRLGQLRSHFGKLFKKWKANAADGASFCTDLKQTEKLYYVDQDWGDDINRGRTQDHVLNLTALYMFEIWSQNQDDEFINQVFGIAGDDHGHDHHEDQNEDEE